MRRVAGRARRSPRASSASTHGEWWRPSRSLPAVACATCAPCGAIHSRASNGTALQTTSRSTRSGCAWANASPTAPQSCTSMRTRSTLQHVQEALDEARVLVDRVLQVAGLAGASKAGQVWSQPTAALQESDPVRRSYSALRAGRSRGQSGAGSCAICRCAAPEHGQLADLATVLLDRGHLARI